MPKSIFRLCGLVGFISFLSKLLGVYRDTCFIHLLGCGSEADLFFFSDRVQKSVFSIVVDGFFSQAVLPVVARYHTSRKKEKLQEVERNILGWGFLLVLLVCLFVFIGSPVLCAIFGFGWFRAWLSSGVEQESALYLQSICLVRRMTPFFATMASASLLGLLLNLRKRYFSTAMVPLLSNFGLVLLTKTSLSQRWEALYVLPVFLAICGAFCLAFQLCSSWYFNIPLFRPSFQWHRSEIRRILRLSPKVFWVAVAGQLTAMLTVFIGTFLGRGTLSRLSYAFRLTEVLAGSFAVGLTTLTSPILSRIYQEGESSKEVNQKKLISARFLQVLDTSLYWAVAVLLPLMLMISSFGWSILQYIYFDNSMRQEEKLQLWWALQCYCLGAIPQTVAKLLSVACFSRHKASIVVRSSLFSTVFEVMVAGLAIRHGALWSCASYGVSGLLRSLAIGRSLRQEEIPLLTTPIPGNLLIAAFLSCVMILTVKAAVLFVVW